MEEREKPNILVSACLLGVECRYNGGGELHQGVYSLTEIANLIPVCPEIYGGLSTPREPAEQVGNRIITIKGADVTEQYQKGAKEALRLATLFGCVCALLKERSPSCGRGEIYDGTFSGSLISGNGVCAALLEKNGIPVFGESQVLGCRSYLCGEK